MFKRLCFIPYLTFMCLQASASQPDCDIYYAPYGMNYNLQKDSVTELFYDPIVALQEFEAPDPANIQYYEELIEQANAIGYELFVERAVGGVYPDTYLYGSLGSIGILDLALMWRVSDGLVEKVISLGYPIGELGVRALVDNYQADSAIKHLELLDYEFSNHRFASSVGNLSFSNFLIANRNFELLEKVKKIGLIDTRSDIVKGDLIDVSEFNVQELAKLNSIFSVEKYNDIYVEKVNANKVAHHDRLTRQQDYENYSLIYSCIGKRAQIPKNKVLFAIPNSQTKLFLEEKGLNLSSPIKDLLVFEPNPMLVENFLFMRERVRVEKFKWKNTENFFGAKIDKNTFYIDPYSSLTFQESMFIERKLSWSEEDARFRLSSLARYILINIDNLSTESKQLKNYTSIKDVRYLGKNLSYYLIFFSDNAEQIPQIIDNFGEPVSDYGLSIIDLLSIVSFIEPRNELKIKALNSIIPNLTLNIDLSKSIALYSEPKTDQ